MKYIFPFLFLFVAACDIPNPQATQTSSNYFDMKSFMEKEMEKLEGKSLEKKITLNSQVEKIKLDNPDWETELSEFISAEINKPSYVDKYAVESLKNGVKRYTAKEDDLPVQFLEVQELPNGSSAIFIEKNNENILNNSSKKLMYRTDGIYSIQAFRHSLGGEPDTIRIEGIF